MVAAGVEQLTVCQDAACLRFPGVVRGRPPAWAHRCGVPFGYVAITLVLRFEPAARVWDEASGSVGAVDIHGPAHADRRRSCRNRRTVTNVTGRLARRLYASGCRFKLAVGSKLTSANVVASQLPIGMGATARTTLRQIGGPAQVETSLENWATPDRRGDMWSC